MAAVTVARQDVLRFRFRRHELDREPDTAGPASEASLLDYGVQDTGHDGAAWALAIRGREPARPDELALVWTVRGAPHSYRRSDLAAVAVATAPFSEADAARRVFDAAKPFKAAGIPVLDGLRTVARHLREVVGTATVKGDASRQVTEKLDEAYLRFCRSCGTIHVHEMPFRLAALQAGLELEPGTSPPVLRPAPDLTPPLYGRLAGESEARLDVIRNHLRFYGPARASDVAAFLDAPVSDVKAHWPAEAVEVAVTDDAAASRPSPRFVLAGDLDALRAGGSGGRARTVRLVGPYDPYLQLRDRELPVADATRRKALWPVLGRPGAVVADGEVTGMWRTRQSGRRLTVRVELWAPMPQPEREAVEEQARRLAAHRSGRSGDAERGALFAGVTWE